MQSSSGTNSAQVDASAPHHPSILLSTLTDSEWLSPALCLLRSQIEYFAARPQDLTAKNRSGGNKAAVVVGQVGIRCVWCKDCPRGERSKGSELYPSNIGLIHQAVRNYQRHHYKSCTRLPAHVRAQIEQAKTQPGRKRQSKSNSKDYWSQSAREAGLVDDNGIFFAEVQEEAEAQAENDQEVEQEELDEQDQKVAQEEKEVQVQVQAAAADEAAPLPFDSIALFGPGLGLIDDDDDDDDDEDHHEAIGAAEKPHQAAEQEAVHVQECMYPSSAPAPAPAPAPVSHHSTTSEADDAMLHEALAILSDDAEDEVGSEDGGGNGFEPLPVRKEELRSTYSTAMSIPPPPTYPQSSTLTTATTLGYSTGTLAEGLAQAPTSWYGSRGPSHTRDQHPLAYSSGLFSSSGTNTTSSTSTTTASHLHPQHGQQHPQPRRHSTMGSSYHTAAEQQQYQQMYQAQQQYRQPRRFSLAGTVSPHRNYHHQHQYGQAAEDHQQRQHMHMHMQSFRNHPSSTFSASEKVAPTIPFASPIHPPPSYAQAPAPLAMPLPLPSTTMTNGAKRRSSVVSSTSDSGCNSPAIATPSTSRSSSYGLAGGASTVATEETMVFPSAAGTSMESNKRARYE